MIHDSSVPTSTTGLQHPLNAEFVKYAHFIDQFQDAGPGEPVDELPAHVYGRVHTNTRFSILGNTTPRPGRADLPERGDPDDDDDPLQQRRERAEPQPGQFDPGLAAARAGPRHPCKLVDCSGSPGGTTSTGDHGTIDPIPFPATGTLGTADDARKLEICVALGYTGTEQPTGLPLDRHGGDDHADPGDSGRRNCANGAGNRGRQLHRHDRPDPPGRLYVNGTLLPTAGGYPM